MNKVIIFPNGSGGVAVMYPAPKYLESLITDEVNNEDTALNLVAQKDVPTGTPYRIVPLADIPADRTDREAWTADFSNPDGVGA